MEEAQGGEGNEKCSGTVESRGGGGRLNMVRRGFD